MAIVSVCIDLAKNVFAVHGVDEAGKPALVRPNVPRPLDVLMQTDFASPLPKRTLDALPF